MVDEAIISGAINSGVNFSLEGIKKIIESFKNRKIAFVQNKETIKKVREDITSNEFKFYKFHLREEAILTPMLLGLTLRRLEKQRDLERLADLKGKIVNKFDTEGLHLSYAVQSGIVSRYITFLMETGKSEEVVKKRLIDFLENLEDYVYFVRSLHFHLERDKARVIGKIAGNSPKVFVISGMGSALRNCSNLINEIKKENLQDYSKEEYSENNRRILYLHKVEI